MRSTETRAPVHGVADHLGECPLWDNNSQTLVWISIHERLLHRWRPDGEAEPATARLTKRIGSIGLCEDAGLLIAALEDEIALLDPNGVRLSGTFIADPRAPTVRLNDGRVAPDGAFLVGGIDEGEPQAPVASLYRWRVGAAPEILLDGISCTNALAFSPDGATLYFADMPSRRIESFRYSPSGLSDRRPFFEFGDRPGLPDGSAVDAEGFVWNAVWGGGAVIRLDPDGKVEREIRLPVSNPTCAAFGGEDLGTLFITTARFGLPPESLAREPLAGRMFACRPGVVGLPEHRIRIGDHHV